ncbi:MAG: hypothetical protein O7F17_01250 [Planctomycetota bacterium]|nr:hypothetical protein [Planctomycetota bacterium]
MTLLSGIRNLVTRKKTPVEVDLQGTQAERLPERVQAAEHSFANRSASAEPNGPGRGSTAAKRGESDVASLLGKIDDRLGAQTDQTQRLLQPMEKLPQAMDAMAEVSGKCTQMLELSRDQVDQARAREEAINAALCRLSDTSAHDTKGLQQVQQQLDLNTQTIRKAAESIGAVSRDLHDVAKSTRRTLEVLSAADRSGEDRDARLVGLLGRAQKRMILVVGLCGATSILAIIMAAMALLI